MTTLNKETEQTRLEPYGRDCACVSRDATECTMWRYHVDRETVIATQDWCECYCHEYDEDEGDN